MELKMFLNNDVLLNKDLSDEAIAAFIALKAIYRKDCDRYYVTVGMLVSYLAGTLSLSRKYTERLANGLTELIDRGITPAFESKGKEYILDLSSLSIEHKNDDTPSVFFTVLELQEVQRIINIAGTRIDKLSLLRYYAAMISTINAQATLIGETDSESKRNFVGFVSMEYIGSLCNISASSTMNTYNHLLEDEKIIYIYRNPELKRNPKTGQYRSFTNHYGRYRDKHFIKEYAINRNDYDGLIRIPKSNANEGRSLSMKYHYLCNGKEYSNDEIKEIYKYIAYTNWQWQKAIDSCSNSRLKDEYKMKLRDMSVFDQFSFLEDLRKREYYRNSELTVDDTDDISDRDTCVITDPLIRSENAQYMPDEDEDDYDYSDDDIWGEDDIWEEDEYDASHTEEVRYYYDRNGMITGYYDDDGKVVIYDMYK